MGYISKKERDNAVVKMDSAIQNYINLFSRRYNVEVEELIKFNVYNFSDMFVDLQTIITAIDNNVAFNDIVDWYFNHYLNKSECKPLDVYIKKKAPTT